MLTRDLWPLHKATMWSIPCGPEGREVGREGGEGGSYCSFNICFLKVHMPRHPTVQIRYRISIY